MYDLSDKIVVSCAAVTDPNCILKGIALAIGYYIMSILEGWVKHNGGGLEMLYSIMTIIVYGLIGTGVSFLGAKFWKWLWK